MSTQHDNHEARARLAQADELVQRHLTVDPVRAAADLAFRRAHRQVWRKLIPARLFKRHRVGSPLVVVDAPQVLTAAAETPRENASTPRWGRRRALTLGFLVTLAAAALLTPGTHSGTDGIGAGAATFTLPLNGTHLTLAVRETGGYTDGFTASGTCKVPEGYRAMIVSRADDGRGYWILSDGVRECVDDDVLHHWAANGVDPSWSGMPPDMAVTIGIVIVRQEVADRANEMKASGKPVSLPEPATSVVILITRVEGS
jgi:hypothetical protein